MRAPILSLLLMLSGVAVAGAGAQEKPEPEAARPEIPIRISMDYPKGWKGETILLPPEFARKMKWKGVETIRFAPGMFKPDQDDFFSYCFVFWFPKEKLPGGKEIQEQMLTYYQGLCEAVSRTRLRDVDVKKFKLKLEPAKDRKLKWIGTLNWREPFVTGKPQTLRFVIRGQIQEKTKSTYLAVAVSPQKADHQIWKDLEKVLASAKFSDPAARKEDAKKDDTGSPNE